MTGAQATPSELERAILAEPDREDLWASFADELDRQGDPHGALLRVHLAEPIDRGRERAIVEANWERWGGGFSPQALRCSWERGFVEAAQLGWGAERARTVRSAAELAALPALRFLRRLDARGFLADHRGLERFPRLERLAWSSSGTEDLAAVRALRLPALNTLRIELRPEAGAPTDAELAAALAAMELPSLRRLELWRGAGATLGPLLDALAAAPWWPGLTGATLGPLTAAEAGALADRTEWLRSGGAGVFLLLRSDEPQTELAELARRLPDARRRTASWGSSSSHFHGGGPHLTELPRLAPLDFRERPPSESLERPAGGSGETETVETGSGVPPDGYDRVKQCLGCGSDDVLRVFAASSSSYGQAETYHFWSGELCCRACGRFTSWEGSSET